MTSSLSRIKTDLLFKKKIALVFDNSNFMALTFKLPVLPH